MTDKLNGLFTQIMEKNIFSHFPLVVFILADSSGLIRPGFQTTEISASTTLHVIASS